MNSTTEAKIRYFDQGPDEEAWAEWQRPHWTENCTAFTQQVWVWQPKGEWVIDALSWVVALVLLASVTISLLAGLG